MNSSEEKKTPAPRGRKPRTSKASTTPVAQHVEENARHISENARDIGNNTKMIHTLYAIIILLVILIAGLAFWLGSVFS
jgi:hypothetical protein